MNTDFVAHRARIRKSIDRLEQVSGATVEEQLRERAKALASLRLRTPDRQLLCEVIVVRRGRTVLGLPIAQAEEVRVVTVSRLPHHARRVAGLFQLRGQVHCLIELEPYGSGSDELRHGERAIVVLLRGTRGALGVRVDEVIGPRSVHADEIDGPHRDRQLEYVRHVTRDCLEIIDVEALLASPSLQLEQSRDG